MIILDLEWNRSYDRTDVHEILQIGAVRKEKLTGPILDTFNVFIRPTIHKKYDLGAKKLPDLQESIHSSVRFPEAWEAFRAWCGEEKEFALWGAGDFAALEKNCAYWRLHYREPEVIYDLQLAYAHLVGAGKQQIALWRAVEYCRIPDVYEYHNALYDAVYTALVADWLREEDLAWRPEPGTHRRRLQWVQEPFPAPPEITVGPMLVPDEVFDSLEARTPHCPFCDRRMWVRQWYYREIRNCLGAVSCPEHGRFLCRLSLERDEEGDMWGMMTLPPVNAELRRQYDASRRANRHLCHSAAKVRQAAPKKETPKKETAKKIKGGLEGGAHHYRARRRKRKTPPRSD